MTGCLLLVTFTPAIDNPFADRIPLRLLVGNIPDVIVVLFDSTLVFIVTALDRTVGILANVRFVGLLTRDA